MITAALQSMVRDLQNAQVAFALVGGMAISVRVEPRFTRDVDLAVVAQTDADAETLVRYLRSRGYTVAVALEQVTTRRLATIRLRSTSPPKASVIVDLMCASCGIEEEICARAEPLEIVKGLTVPVARVGHLVAMKLLSVTPERIRDADDLRGLRTVMNDADKLEAERAVRLIMSRGTHRGRDLRQRSNHRTVLTTSIRLGRLKRTV